MKYLTIVVKVEDGYNAIHIMDAIEKIDGISFSASSWSHVIDERNELIDERNELKVIASNAY